MASRDFVVTVSEDDWLMLDHAAECAGMSVADYVCWGVRLRALQARPSRPQLWAGAVGPTARRVSDRAEETESTAWADSFAERLSARADRSSSDI